jgi:hypothetical protein
MAAAIGRSRLPAAGAGMSAGQGLRGWLAELGYWAAVCGCMMACVPWPSHDAVFSPAHGNPAPAAAILPGHPERLIPDIEPDPEERRLWDQLGEGFRRHLDQL